MIPELDSQRRDVHKDVARVDGHTAPRRCRTTIGAGQRPRGNERVGLGAVGPPRLPVMNNEQLVTQL